jgi:hypothetical protein
MIEFLFYTHYRLLGSPYTESAMPFFMDGMAHFITVGLVF